MLAAGKIKVPLLREYLDGKKQADISKDYDILLNKKLSEKTMVVSP